MHLQFLVAIISTCFVLGSSGYQNPDRNDKNIPSYPSEPTQESAIMHTQEKLKEKYRREAAAIDENQSPRGSSQGLQQSSPQKSPDGSQKNRFQQLDWARTPPDVKEAVKQGPTAKLVNEHLKDGLKPTLFFDLKKQTRYIEFLEKGAKPDLEGAAHALLQRQGSNDPDFAAAVQQLRINTHGHGVNAPFLRQAWTKNQGVSLTPIEFEMLEGTKSPRLLDSKILNQATANSPKTNAQQQTKMSRRELETTYALRDIINSALKNARRELPVSRAETRPKDYMIRTRSNDQKDIARRDPRDTPAVYQKASSWLSNVHPHVHSWVSDKYNDLRSKFKKNGPGSPKIIEQPDKLETQNTAEPLQESKNADWPKEPVPQKRPPQSPPGQGSARTKRRQRQRKAQKERQRLQKQNGAQDPGQREFRLQAGSGGKSNDESRMMQPGFNPNAHSGGYQGPVYKEGTTQLIGYNKGLPADIEKKAQEDYKAQHSGMNPSPQHRSMFGGFFGQGKRLDGPHQNPGHSLLRRNMLLNDL